MRLRVLLIAVAPCAFGLGACDALLGIDYAVPTDAGVPGDGTVAEASPGDSRADRGAKDAASDVATDAHSDAPVDGTACADAAMFTAGFCERVDAGPPVLYCLDFDKTGIPFNDGFYLDGGQIGFSDVEAVSPPTALLTGTPASDANPLAYAEQQLVAVPSYVAFDVRIASDCFDVPGSTQIVSLEIGQGNNNTYVYVNKQGIAFQLEGVTNVEGSKSIYREAGALDLPMQAWVRGRLDFEPRAGGDVGVTFSTGSPGNNDGCFTPRATATLVPPRMDAYVFQSGTVRVRFGLEWSGPNDTCTVYYDNIVIGPYADAG